MISIGSCFSGIGGIEKGLEDTGGFKTKWQIEIDEYATKVLEKHWPNVKRYRDIRDVVRPERVDIITGGYPCQPFSVAGQRKGEQDERHLWPELLRLIRMLRPKYALLENVPGHLSMGFGRVIGDLAESGYDAEWQVLSARQFGANHLRRRIFIVAYPTCERKGRLSKGSWTKRKGTSNINWCRENVANPNRKRLQTCQQDRIFRISPEKSSNYGPAFESSRNKTKRNWWSIEPNMGRTLDGFSSWLHGFDLTQSHKLYLAYANAKQERPGKILSGLLNRVKAQILREETGRQGIFSSQEVLLTFLCKLEAQSEERNALMEGKKIQKSDLRSLWNKEIPPCSPHRWESKKQFTGKPSNPLCLLSQFLALHSEKAWATYRRENASTIHHWETGISRVASSVPSRVDRLKCLGNAVVPACSEYIGNLILKSETQRTDRLT